MNDEVWKTYPEFPFIEGSNLGRVRTIDRYVKHCRGGKRLIKGHILKQYGCGGGYMQVHFSENGQPAIRLVHRIIAECFLPNLNNWPEVNHKDCDPTNNNVNNLEWCTRSYNQQYRNKYGISQTEAQGKPVFAINLKTLEVFHFSARAEASRVLGINDSGISMVIKGKSDYMNGYWFTNADENAVETTRRKFGSVMARKAKGYPVVAINLTTLEVSCFSSRKEAGRSLVIDPSSVTKVIKGKLKQADGYWFVEANSNATEAIRNKFGEKVADKVKKATRNKFGDEVAREVEALMSERELQPA